jgi:hypothetical protein
MGDSNFIRMIGEFDKDKVTKVTLVKLKAITSLEDFNEEKLKKVCLAAASLCTWVRAIEAYASNYLPFNNDSKEAKNLEKPISKSPSKSKRPSTAKVINLRS